ncbi:hypothetical protein Tco_0888717 [Tanacetum coccineum]
MARQNQHPTTSKICSCMHHHTGDDYVLGNLKFVPKGESVEVFGMAIPDPLITEAIQQSSYYPKYLKMVAENTKKTPQGSASMQPATKRATPKKPTTTTPVKQTKPAPPPSKKPSKRKLPQKVRKGKPAFQLVDEEDEAQQESIPQREDDDPDLELAKKLSLETPQEKGEGEGDNADLEWAIKLSLDPAFLPQGRAPVGGVTIRDPVSEATPKLHEVVGKGKAVVTEEQVAHSLIDLSKKKRTTDQFILARRDQSPPDSTTGPSSRPDDDTSEKVIHESSSTSDSERTESDTESGTPKGDKVQGEIVSSTVTSGVSIPVSDPEKAHEALAGPDPEPMNEDQTGSDSGKLHVSLAGPNPEHMDDEFLSTAYPKVHENLKLITDERVFDDKPESHSGSMSSMKNLDDTFNFGDQFLHDKPTEDDQEKSKVREESDSTIPDSSHQTVTSTPPVIAPFTEVSSSKPSLLVTPPPINTEATTITTSLPEITPFIALQLRVARLEQEMSEVKKTDHSADVLASIRSQVPTAVDNYLGTKLDDALLKVLERHTADLIEKYSVLPGPESVKNQESEKSPKEIIKAKKEQDEEKQDSTYSIRSTDKVDLEEFDLKSALFSHMNKKKSANYRLYHSFWSFDCRVEDVPWIRKWQTSVKDHKGQQRKEDMILPLLGQLNLLRKMDQSSKKTKGDLGHCFQKHPLLTSTGWQITDTREAGVDSSMHKSDPELEHSEQSSDDISMQDKGHSQGVDHYVELGSIVVVESDRNMTSVWSMASFTGGLGVRNYISQNTVRPLIMKLSDRRAMRFLCDLRTRISNNLHLNDFEICSSQYLEKAHHCPRRTKTGLHTADNLWIRNGDQINVWVSYSSIVPKPRAVVYRDRNDQRKLMRLHELHKFSDGSLTRVEDDKRRSQRLPHTQSRKDYGSKGLSKSRNALLEEGIRDIDFRLIQLEQRDRHRLTIKRVVRLGTDPIDPAITGRDLPRDNPLHGRNPNKALPVIEGSVCTEGVEELKKNCKDKGCKEEALHSLRQETGSTSFAPDILKMEMEMEIPSSEDVK